MTDNERIRLHISPFNPTLLDRILGPSTKPLASNISFHTQQTFPERGFGYVELPAMEAKKLKAKLNGSTLKGAKVRIEEAKPERKRKHERELETEEERKERKRVKKEKAKREINVLPGHELEEGRRVKRGWTDGEAKEESDRRKAKNKKDAEMGGEGRKMRFKTVVPPNVVPLKEKDVKEKKKKKDREGKRENKEKKKTVVEEFAKTKKSRDVNMGDGTSKHGRLTYEDGKGWVDEDGTVVEAERPSKKPKRRKQAKEEQEETVTAAESVAHEDQAMEDAHSAPQEDNSLGPAESEQDDTSTDESEAPPTHSVPVDSAIGTADEPEKQAGPSSKEVHPLEALFKRPAPVFEGSRPKPGPIDTSFSFFDATAADAEAEEDAANMPPQTPHTRRDLEWRSIRSAAPTPDTAAIGRKFSFPFAGDEEDEDAEEGEEDVEMGGAQQAIAGAEGDGGEEGKGEESAFRKWFYEHRGEFNRGWKKRRREEKKARRQRENRRLSQKIS